MAAPHKGVAPGDEHGGQYSEDEGDKGDDHYQGEAGARHHKSPVGQGQSSSEAADDCRGKCVGRHGGHEQGTDHQNHPEVEDLGKDMADEWMVARDYMSRDSPARIYRQATSESEREVTHAVAIPIH